MGLLVSSDGRTFVQVGNETVEVFPVNVSASPVASTPRSVPDEPFWKKYANVAIKVADGEVMTHDIYAGKVKLYHPTVSEDSKLLMYHGYLKKADVVWENEDMAKRAKKAHGCRKDGTAISFKYGKRASWRPAHLCRLVK